ncbi:lasso peptide biosynthesis B2 protein [Deinococcus sp. VB142]|uniref:Lasso peptide biosynthesis B2 protein n=1 Tax=Deinococcus sp. VB142 TaxID=3112952 RepID=A0AAU6Q4Q0_9DEIO
MPPLPDPAVLSRVLTHPEALGKDDLPHVLAAGAGGAVRARLPEGHPLREPLRKQALDLGVRHSALRAELRPLLAAWAAEGIEVLLFKGFALAEFEYASAGERFHGDVDIVLPEDAALVMRAAHIALALGWRSDGQHADPATWTHECMHLFSPQGQVRIDGHRWLVTPLSGAKTERLRNFTAQVWQRAEHRDWDGIPVRLMQPLDAAVFVGLGRSWGGDTGGVKPADYLDLQLFIRKYGLDRAALQTRAEALGGGGTWRAFEQVCQPLTQTLQLDMAQTRSLIAAGLAQDGLNARRGLWRSRMMTLKQTWPLLPSALVDVAAAWWAVRRGGDPRRHLRAWTPARAPVRLPLRELNRRLVAVHWWVRLLYPKQFHQGVCLPRAYASYRNLRRAGHPVTFISGAGRQAGQFAAHAWIEDDHGAIELYNEPLNRQRFGVVFSHPAEADSARP